MLLGSSLSRASFGMTVGCAGGKQLNCTKVWSKFQITSSKFQINSNLKKIQNYVVLLLVRHFEGGTTEKSPFIIDQTFFCYWGRLFPGDSRPYRTVRSGGPQSCLLRNDAVACESGTLYNLKSFLCASVCLRLQIKIQ